MKYIANWEAKKGHKKYHGTEDTTAKCLLAAHNTIRQRVAKRYKMHKDNIQITAIKVK